MTITRARTELIASDLFPRPLFPARVPPKLARADVTLSVKDPDQGQGSNDFAVDYLLKNADGDLPRIVGFRRFSRGSLRESLRGWRARRSPVRLVKVAGRVRYAFHDDISFGYAWIQDGKAYFAPSKYYGRFTWNDLRRMVASMRHLTRP